MPPQRMKDLTLKDTQRLLHAIQELYSLYDLSSFGVKALAILHRLVPSEVPAFSLTNLQTRVISNTFLPGYPSYIPGMEQVACRHWAEHPIVQHMPHTLEGAYKISGFLTQAEFQRLEGLCHQFLRLINCEEQMTLFLPQSESRSRVLPLRLNEPLVTIALSRRQRNFTERDRLILNLLRPHLFQAYCNARQYDRMQQNLAQLHQSLNHLGLIILNGDGQIQFITPSAIQWLQTYFAKFTHADRLPEHLWAWVRHQISGYTNNHLPAACLPLRIERGNKQLVIRFVIEQIRERYLLVLEEQTLSWLNSLELLGLSHREADVLHWVMRGKDNQAIAKHLDIHIGTVRKHLESIYRKLGVQSRTEAIAQALKKLGVFN